MPRRALLLAIADYDPLPALDYVSNDIPRLKAALTRAGFEPKRIEAVGAGSGETRVRELTTARLRAAIVDFLDSADPADEMLIFFSGHGIELDGRRLLLPQDFTPRHSGSADDVVSDSWISGYARGCKARSVIVLIDACREGARYALAPSKSAAAENDTPLKNEYSDEATDAPTIAFLYSCAAGEQSGRDFQGEDYSAFTRALAETIELEKGPAELEAIAAEARRRLAASSAGKQTLVVSGRGGHAGQWERLITKEDEAARFRERLKRSDWSHRLAATELFRSVEAKLPAFATQLKALAMRAEEQVAEARRVLPIQRWRDESAWRRQAARIRHVFLPTETGGDIPAAEVAVLLAVPFVYEAALAAAETRLVAAGAMPDPELISTSGYLVGAWRNAWRNSDAAQIRRALIAQNKQDAADDHSCWSLVGFCHTSGELWDEECAAQNRTGWAFDAITALVAPAPLPEITHDRRVSEILSAPRLLRLARLMFAGFDDVTLDVAYGNESLDPEFSCGEFNSQLTINEVRVAHLLNLGSQLTLDPRRMPPVLAEHVGTDDVLSADWIRMQVAGAEWQTRIADGVASGQGERWFDLKLDCANDAVDAALLAVVDALESYKTRLSQRQDVHARAMRDLLPAGFTVNRLNAGPSGWRPTRPPLRFELDRTRIIGLLMGQQLYGERWPALRELYQNALDACRYRRAAEQLAVRERRNRVGKAYEGRIAINFGIDRGRRFVECVDNGIGMADRHIRRLFAYAGQRFADSHEFHIDRARWDVADIKFFPNSRFGVGVLSYFMLAEELDIASHRWAPPNDLAAPSVRARIIGSGSLFRLETLIDPTRLTDDYGTSVRLYLREDAPNNDALLESILDWLFVPETAVTISPEVGEAVNLVAGTPTDRFRALARAALLPVKGSEGSTGSPRVYIAPSINRVVGSDRHLALVDGISTNLSGAPWPGSIIANLTEDLRSSLTVDRRVVDAGEMEIEFVRRCIKENGGAALVAWSNPEFVSLHRTLRELDPKVTVAADAVLRAMVKPRAIATPPKWGLSWPLSIAGLSYFDPEIACELLLSSGVDVRGRHRYSGDVNGDDLAELGFRNSVEETLDPVIVRGLLSRAMELANAGLSLSKWLERAVLFEGRNGLNSYPATCGPVVEVINACGRIALREVLRWTDEDLVPVLDAAREIADLSPGLLSFDLDGLEALDPLERSLCRLSSANRLTWIELTYFSQSEELPFQSIVKVAENLARYGLIIQNLEMPEHITLSKEEMKTLGALFAQIERTPVLYPIWSSPYVSRDGNLNNIAKRLGVSGNEPEPPCPPNLSARQKIFVSRDIDGEGPFLNFITPSQLFDRARDAHFGSIFEAVDVARSFINTELQLSSRIVGLDNGLIGQIDAIPMSDITMAILRRLFADLECCRSSSVWDFALAATAAGIEPPALSPVLDLMEHFGGDVARCREFLGFCAEN